MNTKIMILGDTHANPPSMQKAIRAAAELDLAAIVQVGDFGFWPNDPGGLAFLENVSGTATEAGVPVYAIPGNHEDWKAWLEVIEDADKDWQGFAKYLPNLKIAPPVHNWKWGHTIFASVGGAYSIDRRSRTLNRSWFEEELPQWEYLGSLPDGGVDVLLTHDAPQNLAVALGWPSVQIDEPDDAAQAQAVIQAVYDKIRPSLGVHGHWHTQLVYQWEGATVIGLDQASGSPLGRSAAVLDVIERKCQSWDQFIYESKETKWQH